MPTERFFTRAVYKHAWFLVNVNRSRTNQIRNICKALKLVGVYRKGEQEKEW